MYWRGAGLQVGHMLERGGSGLSPTLDRLQLRYCPSYPALANNPNPSPRPAAALLCLPLQAPDSPSLYRALTPSPIHSPSCGPGSGSGSPPSPHAALGWAGAGGGGAEPQAGPHLPHSPPAQVTWSPFAGLPAPSRTSDFALEYLQVRARG